MQIISLLILFYQTYCIDTVKLTRTAIVANAILSVQHGSHIPVNRPIAFVPSAFRGKEPAISHSVSSLVSNNIRNSYEQALIPSKSVTVTKLNEQVEMTREINDYASAVARNVYEKSLNSPKSLTPNQQNFIEATVPEKLKPSRGRFMFKVFTKKLPYTASTDRPNIKFDKIKFDEATQTYIVPKELMQPYYDAIVGARAKVVEDESAKFIKNNQAVGNIVGQGVVQGLYGVGLNLLCVLMNSPIKLVSEFAVNKLADVINRDPSPKIAESFFRGQCNHAGVEHSLWMAKMNGLLKFRL